MKFRTGFSVGYSNIVVVVVVSHIQRIGCQPEKTTVLYTVANLARGLLNRERKQTNKKTSGSAPPPPPPPARAARSEYIYIYSISRDASTCLGATQVGVTQVVSVRLASVQGFLRLVS